MKGFGAKQSEHPEPVHQKGNASKPFTGTAVLVMVSRMGVSSRLCVLALVASLALACPVHADGSDGSGSCGDPGSCPSSSSDSGNSTSGNPSSGNSTSGNSTSGNPPSNQTSPGQPSPQPSPVAGVQQRVDAAMARVSVFRGGNCDLVRATGSDPYVSVNPVLGIVKVDLGCVTRQVGSVVQTPHQLPFKFPYPHL